MRERFLAAFQPQDVHSRETPFEHVQVLMRSSHPSPSAGLSLHSGGTRSSSPGLDHARRNVRRESLHGDGDML